MDNKTAMQELLEWVMEFEDKPVKPTLTNMKEKIWQLLPKERQQIEEAYQSGGRNALKYPRDYPRHVTKEEYFNQTYQNTQQNPELLTQ